MTYEFTKDLSTANWTIMIDPVAKYGYFERNSDGTGGGLWFEDTEEAENLGRVSQLVDYDGVPELPQEIVNTLRAANYLLDDTFDPYVPTPPTERRR